MKILLVGGTGIISTAVSKSIINAGHELWTLNRGSASSRIPSGAHVITADINDTSTVSSLLKGEFFDCIADFTVQSLEQIDRDYSLFAGKTKQYIFISSSCVYQRPLSHYILTEASPVCNPYWDYAQRKIACENRLMDIYRSCDFPVTIIRPGHTYDDRWLPLCISGSHGGYCIIKRMLAEKPVIIPGDGTSLWTLTHNSDFARAFLGLIGNPYALGETVNISSDEVMTWNQIYQTIADALGVHLKPFYVSSMFLHQAGPYDFKSCLLGERVQSAVFCNDKLKRLVPGFQAQIPVRTGIRDTLNHILTNPDLQEEDPTFDAWSDSLVSTLTHAADELKKAFPSPL